MIDGGLSVRRETEVIHISYAEMAYMSEEDKSVLRQLEEVDEYSIHIWFEPDRRRTMIEVTIPVPSITLL